MEASSTRRTDVPSDRVRQIDWHVVWTWLLCFGLIAYLGLEGGGFDPLVHDQVGIAVWWVLLAALLVGAVPRRPLGPAGWSAVALLAIFAIWSALSLTWTESLERTWADVARVLAYLGVFALALFTRGEGERRQLLAAVGTGIAFVGVIALLSRLHPAWFPASSQTGEFLSSGRERLSYPLNYWNGLAALLAMGLPLVLQAAACARSVLGRALAAAALPLMALAIFFTLSRGGIAASAVVVVVFLAFAGDRLPKLLSLLVAAGGGAILILAAAARDALQHGLANSSAQSQGDEMLWLTLAVCFTAGIVQAGIALIERRHGRPRWLTFNRQQVQIGALLCAAALVVAAIAIGISGRVSNGWNEFKVGGNPGGGTQRLTSAAGQHRYQYWSSAVEEDAHKPLTGTGSGTFE